MRVIDQLNLPTPVFSFEFFPPKTAEGEEALFKTVSKMQDLNPSFVSVTCGAGGSTRGRTIEWAKRIKADFGIEAMVHLTCMGLDEQELNATIAEVQESGLDNILALRGDPPADGSVVKSHCNFANEMISLVRASHPNVCIGAACYPEGHVESASRMSDLENLKKKADAGADFFVSQLFFDNSHFFEFLGRARSMGITQPIIPGIMPIHNVEQTKKFINMCGATIPSHLMKLLEQYQDSKRAVFYIGVAHAIAQCSALLQAGVPGIHFYTLNRSPATRLVLEALRG